MRLAISPQVVGVGQAVFEAELGAQQFVHAAHDVGHHRRGV
jgi:hypothetical protein